MTYIFLALYVVGIFTTILAAGISDNFNKELDDGEVLLTAITWPITITAICVIAMSFNAFYCIKHTGEKIRKKIKNS